MSDYRVLLYYKYVPITDPGAFRDEHRALCQSLGLKGRIVIGAEGINGTCAGPVEATNAYKQALQSDFRFADIQFKEDTADFVPFPKLKIKVRDEIVTLDAPAATPDNGGQHLSPHDWHQLAQQDDVVVLDARNDYEWEVGKFKNALTPAIENFRDFPQWAEQHADELVGKKVLMYCTGGIRCERASAVVKQAGITEVYQLEGGIIEYGKAIPNGLWEGSCFVFDDRRTVQVNDDQHHSVISRCRFCATLTDDYHNCCNAECNKLILLCTDCRERSNNACSQDCATKHRDGVVKHWDITLKTAV